MSAEQVEDGGLIRKQRPADEPDRKCATKPKQGAQRGSKVLKSCRDGDSLSQVADLLLIKKKKTD